MKYVLYSTSKSSWYQGQANLAALYLSKNGRKVEIEVRHVRPPRNPQMIIDSDGDRRFSWDWFTQYFPNEHDGVGFHFTSYYKRKWGISPRINGSKNTMNKDYPEFWMCCEKEEAYGYDLISNFVRLLIHEVSHFDEDLDNDYGNTLTQESVHRWDYELKSIHHYPKFVNYRAYRFRQKIAALTVKVVALAQAFIRNITER